MSCGRCVLYGLTLPCSGALGPGQCARARAHLIHGVPSHAGIRSVQSQLVVSVDESEVLHAETPQLVWQHALSLGITAGTKTGILDMQNYHYSELRGKKSSFFFFLFFKSANDYVVKLINIWKTPLWILGKWDDQFWLQLFNLLNRIMNRVINMKINSKWSSMLINKKQLHW